MDLLYIGFKRKREKVTKADPSVEGWFEWWGRWTRMWWSGSCCCCRRRRRRRRLVVGRRGKGRSRSSSWRRRRRRKGVKEGQTGREKRIFLLNISLQRRAYKRGGRCGSDGHQDALVTKPLQEAACNCGVCVREGLCKPSDIPASLDYGDDYSVTRNQKQRSRWGWCQSRCGRRVCPHWKTQERARSFQRTPQWLSKRN